MAVYTQITKEEFATLGYEIGAVNDFTPILAGVDNSNYLVTASAGKYVFTIIENLDVTNLAKILEAQNTLDIPKPQVILNKNKLFTYFQQKPAILAEFIEGASPTVITAEHTMMLGGVLKNMHKLALKTNIPNRMNVECLEALTQKVVGDLYLPQQHMIFKALDIAKATAKHRKKVFIHADLFPDNVFFKNNEISGIIDFYFSCTDHPLYDVAIALNAWCFKDGILDTDLYLGFRQGYFGYKETPQHLLLFAIRAALRILLTRLYDRKLYKDGHYVQAKDPEEYFSILGYHMSLLNP